MQVTDKYSQTKYKVEYLHISATGATNIFITETKYLILNYLYYEYNKRFLRANILSLFLHKNSIITTSSSLT